MIIHPDDVKRANVLLEHLSPKEAVATLINCCRWSFEKAQGAVDAALMKKSPSLLGSLSKSDLEAVRKPGDGTDDVSGGDDDNDVFSPLRKNVSG